MERLLFTLLEPIEAVASHGISQSFLWQMYMINSMSMLFHYIRVLRVFSKPLALLNCDKWYVLMPHGGIFSYSWFLLTLFTVPATSGLKCRAGNLKISQTQG